MPSVVFDASALIALLAGEPSADKVAHCIGDGMISAVNVQEVEKALLRRGASLDAAKAMFDALHLDVRFHDRQEAFCAASLVEVTTHFGAGTGDRSCMALAIAHTSPAITMDKEWAHFRRTGINSYCGTMTAYDITNAAPYSKLGDIFTLNHP